MYSFAMAIKSANLDYLVKRPSFDYRFSMPSTLPPGAGEHGPIQRRIAAIERFLGGLKRHKIVAVTEFGRNRVYEILAQEGRFKASEDASIPISWRLSVTFDDPDYKWSVSAINSTITEGTNGTLIDLSSDSSKWLASTAIKFDVLTNITASQWIVLECAVSSTFVLSNFTFKAVSTRTNALEVKFLTTGTLQQEKLRMLIGKIIFEDGVPRVVQGEKNEQFIDWGMLNSRAIKCFLSPQRDPDLLV
jgi:hypothetical protein